LVISTDLQYLINNTVPSRVETQIIKHISI